MDEYISFFVELSFFEAFSIEEIFNILGILKERKVTGGDVICREGDMGRSCYFLVDGCVRVYLTQYESEKELALLNSGDLFGHLALIDGGTRTASCAALVDSTLLEMEWDVFQFLFTSDSPSSFKFVDAMAQLLVGQLRNTNEKLMAMCGDGEDFTSLEEDEEQVFNNILASSDGANLDKVKVTLPKGKRPQRH